MAVQNGKSEFDTTYQNLNYNSPCSLFSTNATNTTNLTVFPDCEDPTTNLLYNVD